MAFWDLLSDSEPKKSAYEEGREAYRNGLSYWDNPYCKPTSQAIKTNPWWAGWTYEKQLDKLNKAAWD